ncbi:hypothetical protein [Flindersiella endophytica]
MSEAAHGGALRTYLFGESAGERGDSIETISRSLHERGPARTAMYGISRLGTEALGVVDEQVAGMVHNLLEYDVGDLLVRGWKAYSQLRSAARRTVENSGQEEVVELATHTVTWIYKPKVDMLVNGRKVNSLEFVLTVEFEINGLVAVVRNGHLMALRSGECVITTTLTLEGGTIVPKRETPVDDLSVLLPLRRPIRLVSDGR